jgi:hypothetical protein
MLLDISWLNLFFKDCLCFDINEKMKLIFLMFLVGYPHEQMVLLIMSIRKLRDHDHFADLYSLHVWKKDLKTIKKPSPNYGSKHSTKHHSKQQESS